MEGKGRTKGDDGRNILSALIDARARVSVSKSGVRIRRRS